MNYKETLQWNENIYIFLKVYIIYFNILEKRDVIVRSRLYWHEILMNIIRYALATTSKKSRFGKFGVVEII